MRSKAAILGALGATLALAAAASGQTPDVTKLIPAIGDLVRAGRAREAILEIDLPAAKKVLDGASGTDQALAIEQARYAIYAGDYDGAAKILERADLARTEEGAGLGDIARGSARGMAATVEIRDDERGLTIRLQDEDDRALVPVLAEVAVKVRATLMKDLGVELLRPLRIDLVRDQFTLAAMTGLPEQAAQTTGTVAVAKWGRVTMISPRAMSHGYPWLDTLAHEMTHLALSRGTRDRRGARRGVRAWRSPRRWAGPRRARDRAAARAPSARGERAISCPIRRGRCRSPPGWPCRRRRSPSPSSGAARAAAARRRRPPWSRSG